MKLAVKSFIEEHAPLDDALEHVVESPSLHVQGKRVLEQFSHLSAQTKIADGKIEDVEFCVVALLCFLAALLGSTASSYLSSDSDVFERVGRREPGPEAIRTSEDVLSFAEGGCVTANDPCQLGWLNRAVGKSEQALGNFKRLADRFPDNENSAGPASLGFAEIESESSSASSSGFRLGGLDIVAGRRAPGCVFRNEGFHLPLQCARQSVATLLEQVGQGLSLDDGGRALGTVLVSNSEFPSAIVGLGAQVLAATAANVLAGQDGVGVLVVRRGRTSLLTHALWPDFLVDSCIGADASVGAMGSVWSGERPVASHVGRVK